MTTELRLALAMRGGVSLAVWIGGAISEIDLARRAGAGDDDEPGFWSQVIGASRYDEVVVDVLAGASAGGLNGVLYAASQVYDFRYGAMRQIWLDLGSTEGLVRRQGPWPSLMKGDEFFLAKVHDRLVSQTGQPARPCSAPPRLDLLLSATAIEPIERPLPSPVDESLVERRFSSGFRFRQPEDAWLPTDFPPPATEGFEDALWRLAIAARSTSSYPGAFEGALVRSSRRACFASPGAAGDGSAVDLDGAFLDRSSRPVPFVVADGGILDNIPISRALEAVAAAPASGPTERVVVYLQPGAPSPAAEAIARKDQDRRSAVAVVRGTIASRVAGETINPDIAALEAYNESVKRAAALRTGSLGAISPGDLVAAATGQLASYRLARAAEEAGRVVALLRDPVTVLGEDPFPDQLGGAPVTDGQWRSPTAGWPATVREQLLAQLAAVIGERLGGTVADVLTGTGDPRPLLRVTGLLIEWARDLEQLNCPPATAAKAQLYRVRSFAEEVLDRTRRLGWVVHAVEATDPVAFAGTAHDVLGRLTKVPQVLCEQVCASLGDGTDGGLAAARLELLRRLDGVAAPAGAVDLLEAMTARLVEVAEKLRLATLDVPGGGAGSLLDGQLRPVPVTAAVLGALEVVCLPEAVLGLPGRRRIDFHRLSSANRTPLAPHFLALLAEGEAAGLRWDRAAPEGSPPAGLHVNLKLAGNELANFSAFLLAQWRANDWLWGRLDAVPTLIDLLVRAEDLVGDHRDAAALVETVHQLVVPAGHRWADDLERWVWAPSREDVTREAAQLFDPASDEVDVTAIRNVLVARRQWEILGEECREPTGPMGTEPGGDLRPPSFEEVRAWAAAYRVGAQTMRDSGGKASELVDRLSELATAATETVLWNVGRPGSPVPRPPRLVETAVRRAVPRLGRRMAEGLVRPRSPEGPRPSKMATAAATVMAVTVVLATLGFFIDKWAFVLGLAVSVVPIGLVIWVLWRRLRRLLAPPD